MGLEYGTHSTSKREVEDVTKVLSIKKVSGAVDHKKNIKFSILTGMIVYLILLFGGLGVATEDGYSLIFHTICQLGTLRMTPLPLLFDISSIVGGFTIVAFNWYLLKMMECLLFLKIKTRIFYCVFPKIIFITGIVGSVGIIFVGVFSLDRAFGILHSIFSALAFGGFIISLLGYGFLISRFNTGIPKIIGIIGFLPFVSFIGFCVSPSPLLEWILLLTIISTFLPLFGWTVFNKK